MRRYGLYDATRGLTLALAAGLAGLLLYLATRVGQQTTGRFWGEMGIVAGAGLVLGLAPRLGSWTAGLRLRISPGTFLLGFLPVLVVVGWILVATQPGHGWHDGTVTSWSRSIGILGLVHDLALWHGVLAFGFGLVLGYTLDAVPVPVVAPEPMPVAHRERTVVRDADAPLRAEEREATRTGEPAAVGRTTPEE